MYICRIWENLPEHQFRKLVVCQIFNIIQDSKSWYSTCYRWIDFSNLLKQLFKNNSLKNLYFSSGKNKPLCEVTYREGLKKIMKISNKHWFSFSTFTFFRKLFLQRQSNEQLVCLDTTWSLAAQAYAREFVSNDNLFPNAKPEGVPVAVDITNNTEFPEVDIVAIFRKVSTVFKAFDNIKFFEAAFLLLKFRPQNSKSSNKK